MPSWFTKLTSSQKWAAYRNYISFGAGMLASLGMITTIQQQDMLTAFDSIFAGSKQVIAGFITIGGILGPIAMGWWASHRASPKEQIAAVVAMVNDPTALPVKGVITEATPAGAALAASIPGAVVTAGSLEAAQIAQAPTIGGKTATGGGKAP